MMTTIAPVIDGLSEEEQARIIEIADAISHELGWAFEQWEEDADWMRGIAARARFYNKERVKPADLAKGDQVQLYDADQGELVIRKVTGLTTMGDCIGVKFNGPPEEKRYGKDAKLWRIKEG
jgi:hypothetical protein